MPTKSPTNAQGPVASVTSASTSSPLATPSAAPSSGEDAIPGDSDAMPAGAKIGLAIGVAAVGVVSVAGILVFYSSRRRKQKDAENRVLKMNNPTVAAGRGAPEIFRGATATVAPSAWASGVPICNGSVVSSPRNRPSSPMNGLSYTKPPTFAELDSGEGSRS
jgi:cbb3-type cytochrome oxidase subunit 3